MRRAHARSAVLRLPLGLCDGGSSSHGAALGAALLVACAVAGAMAPWEGTSSGPAAAWSMLGAGVRGPVAMALVALAAVLHRAATRRRRPRHGWLVVDDGGVRRVGRARESMILDWREPFG